MASPIRCILGGSSATHSTVAAIGTITEQGSLSCCVLDHSCKIPQTCMDLKKGWRKLPGDGTWDCTPTSASLCQPLSLPTERGLDAVGREPWD